MTEEYPLSVENQSLLASSLDVSGYWKCCRLNRGSLFKCVVITSNDHEENGGIINNRLKLMIQFCADRDCAQGNDISFW